MKYADNFDRNTSWWDGYRRFYILVGKRDKSGWNDKDGAFIRFETGELICTTTFDRDPSARKEYKALGLTICSTEDSRCPTLYDAEGKKVLKGWLPSQNLLVDHETGRAVKLRRNYESQYTKLNEWAKPIPTALRGRATAYFPGEGEPPVGAPIKTDQPAPLSPDERARLSDLKAQANAWARLTDQDTKPEFGGYKPSTPLEASMVTAPLDTQLRFADLIDTQKLQLARHGWIMPRLKIEHPYLLTEGKTK